jgi:hypothetical protein
MLDIVFTDTQGIAEEFKPKPANSFIPDWYKNLLSYIGEEKKPTGNGNTSATIKRCMPVFDAIAGGYIITTYTDIFVSQKNVVDENGISSEGTSPWYEWPSFNPLSWHPVEQAPNHPSKGDMPSGASYPKWNNPWAIKTPPGYSVLFIQPMHRDAPFTILPGIVDTDTYTAPVNFPFVLNDWKFEGLIPAGTPMVQVIPFKRDSWEMGIGEIKDLEEQNKVSVKLRTRFFDSYKNHFRQLKEYK